MLAGLAVTTVMSMHAMIAGVVTTDHLMSAIAKQAKSSVLETLQGLQPRDKRLLMLVHQSDTIHNHAHGEQRFTMRTFTDPRGACALWSIAICARMHAAL